MERDKNVSANSDQSEGYIISIVGNQTVENKKDEDIALTAVGSYEYANGQAKIVYYEYNGDDPNMRTKAVLEVSNDKVIMTKTGYLKSQIILERNKRHLCNYETELGSFMIGICTDDMTVSLSREGGFIKAAYSLDLNSNMTSFNMIEIIVKKENQ